MTWRKFFKPVNSVLPSNQRQIGSQAGVASHSKFDSLLPAVYAGPQNRISRYVILDQMNLDHEISAALDTIADFGTEPDEITKIPFLVDYNDEPTPSEVTIIEKSLGQWIRLNELSKRTWKIFRSTLQYGDQFFIRDPETFKLYWVDPAKVEKVIVNESDGKKIESFWISDIDLNMKSLVATNQLNKASVQNFGSSGLVMAAPLGGNISYPAGGYGAGTNGMSSYNDNGAMAVDAEHIVQVTLTDGMSSAWPFGISILETIFKVYKQKELLEDAILIYRIHRAPERRVFFIDVGTMPPNKAAQYLERIRYEVQQKRIPSRTGGGQNISDSTYNPLCFDMSTRIPLLDGRTLSITDLAVEHKEGKENWAYSCDPVTGKVVPGVITWAGKTQENAKVIKITLDNDEIITCTPTHKIPVLGKGFVEAKDLTTEDSLISYETRQKSLSHDVNRSYTQVFDHSENKWKFTHRMVAEYFREKDAHQVMIFDEKSTDLEKNIVHHKNFNRYDNSPSNLAWMNHRDHIDYHSKSKKEFWENLPEEESLRLREKYRQSQLKYIKDFPDEFAERFVDRDISWIATMAKDEPEKYKKWRTKLGASLSEFYEEDSDRAKELKLKASASMKKNQAKNQYLVFTQEMHDRLVTVVLENNSNRLETIALVNEDNSFLKLLKDANPIQSNSTENVNNEKFTNSKLTRMYKKFGYKDWVDFKIQITGTRKDLRAIIYNQQALTRFVNIVKPFIHTNTKKHCIALSSKDSEFKRILIESNPGISKRVDFDNIDDSKVQRMLSTFGYIDWQDFKEKIQFYNHKIKSIEYLDETMDVGTITIDGKEKWHNYHTFAIESGIFVKNSTLEDYYFSVGSDGRGSKVEVLPGGENLGSIDDLRYFNNKMMRALGVPSSYLPTGPEDGTATVSDGRVGTAFIQEFRFAKIIKRYQQQIVKPFDTEFKLFLKRRGITIDSSLFQLQFTEPQSFSEYRQMELDAQKMNLFSAIESTPYVSKRFALKRYLGWSEEELVENERMWREERSKGYKSGNTDADSSAPSQLSDVGITSSGIDTMSPDTGDLEGGEGDLGQGVEDTGNADVSSNEVDNFGGQ